MNAILSKIKDKKMWYFKDENINNSFESYIDSINLVLLINFNNFS